MDIQSILKKEIKQALLTCGINAGEVSLEHPTELVHGDFSTNVALVYAKEARMNPRVLAEKVMEILKSRISGNFERLEIAGPGFINFYLSPLFFQKKLTEITGTKNFGHTSLLKGEKVLVEHTQPNPFKEFHIGHLMNNAIGESLSRIIAWNGAKKVKQATYHGDVGMHVAKTVWAVMKEGLELTDTTSLGRAYALGAKAFEEDEVAKVEIIALNKKIYEGKDKAIIAIYKKGRQISFDDFDRLYKKLGSKFDHHFYESESAVLGKKTVLAHLRDGIFEKSQNAFIFKGENFGLHTRVFLNAEGLPTYEAKEIGLAELKRKKFNFTMAVTVVGNEQADYFKVVNKAIELIHPSLSGKMYPVPHGMLRLTTGKMSSRTGSVISADSLLDEVEGKVSEKIKDRGYDEKQKTSIIHAVSIGAIKYSILKQSIGTDIIYDFDKSISFEGDSGPYLQYTYARARSILLKAKAAKIKSSVKIAPPSVYALERTLYRFPEIVERSGKEFAPHYIATFLTELASAFNAYYAQNKIVDPNDSLSSYRIALSEAVSVVLKNGLFLLGIEAPEKM